MIRIPRGASCSCHVR